MRKQIFEFFIYYMNLHGEFKKIYDTGLERGGGYKNVKKLEKRI
jgi:hypothetical protein